jgi:hypothetical protein
MERVRTGMLQVAFAEKARDWSYITFRPQSAEGNVRAEGVGARLRTHSGLSVDRGTPTGGPSGEKPVRDACLFWWMLSLQLRNRRRSLPISARRRVAFGRQRGPVVPTVNPKQLSIACESVDNHADGRSPQVDLVRRGWAFPVARSLGNRSSRPSASAQCAEA